MTVGLNVSRLINVAVNLTPAGAQFANLGTLLILGQSDVIDTQTRIMSFSSLSAVAALFGTSAPEYLAAKAYFGQLPQPTQVYIGRWAQSAVSGRLFGGALTASQQALSNWTAITSGGFKITVDSGSAVNISGLNFSGASNLNAVATIIQTALTTASVAATVVWNGSQFVLTSNSTGTSSKVAPLTAPASGTNIQAMLAGTIATGAREVDGIAAESLITAVTILDGLSTYWYGLNDDACTSAVDADREAVAAYIEAASSPHLYGFTTAAAGALSTVAQTDVGAVLQALGYKRTFVVWSSTSAYAASSAFGRLLTTNFAGQNTMITLAYKTLPGIAPETLTGAQAAALDSKGYNYFASYANGAAILNNGWSICSSPTANEIYVDEMYGADALANQIQTNYFNLLASAGKVPQTDAGSELGGNAIETALAAFVTNGYLAPGTWNVGGFGQLAQGDWLPKGYYIYIPLIASQAQTDRTARKSVPYQVAAKTAGAVSAAT